VPSLRERISQASQALFGRETRNVPLPFEQMYQGWGMPPLFDPTGALHSYGDNAFLAGAVDKISREISRTKFYLQTVNAKGEIEIIQKHQALETLRRPQPTKTGKSVLSSMDLKLVTGYHLCLAGEAFWLLDKRLKVNGAPTAIDILLPTFVYQFKDTLDNDYLPAFPGTEGMVWAYPDPVPENMEEKRANAAALFAAGGLTPDEFRKSFGLDPLAISGVTDIPYVPIGMIPAGEPPPSLAA